MEWDKEETTRGTVWVAIWHRDAIRTFTNALRIVFWGMILNEPSVKIEVPPGIRDVLIELQERKHIQTPLGDASSFVIKHTITPPRQPVVRNGYSAYVPKWLSPWKN